MVSVLLSLLFFFAPVAHAQTQAELQAQIDQSTSQIAQLKKEIEQLQVELNSTSKQKQTLQSVVAEFNLNIQKITKSITLTNTQIAQKDTEIRQLAGSISTTANRMDTTGTEVEESLRQLAILDNEPIVLTFMRGDSLSSYFDAVVTLTALRLELKNKIGQLSNLKTNLTSSKTTAEQKRSELAALKNNLAEQKQSLAIARDAQNQILTQTKNKESNYQALLAEKKAQEAKFEQDLLNYALQLNKKLDTGSVPQAGSGVLRWPVDSPYITQYFGNTPFATANASVYGNKGHNAIDLRAPVGTLIRAARQGVVLGTGNTDLTCNGASFGKWVFIKHDNGLSTVYAHLSTISVAEGQSVAAGQVIGYSGITGYATGPHLHFGVYASEGSQIATLKSNGCKGRIYTVPLVTDPKAYLNPLSYLPAL